MGGNSDSNLRMNGPAQQGNELCARQVIGLVHRRGRPDARPGSSGLLAAPICAVALFAGCGAGGPVAMIAAREAREHPEGPRLALEPPSTSTERPPARSEIPDRSPGERLAQGHQGRRDPLTRTRVALGRKDAMWLSPWANRHRSPTRMLISVVW